MVRSFDHAWNLGHVVSFFIWTLTYLYVSSGRDTHPSFFKQSPVVLAVTLGVAVGIEWAQLFFDRSADVDDIIKGLLGSLTALVFFSSARMTLPRRYLRTLQTLVVMLIVSAAYPMASAFIDESIARSQFPVLSDFETVFETQRWHGSAGYAIDRDMAFHGRRSLKVSFNTTRYSGITLHHFPESWAPYRLIEFSIYNPSPKHLDITCSIHDRLHRANGMKYRDRFNRRFDVHYGWNTFRIAMEEINRAPQGRQMDLSQIRNFSIVVSRLPQPETIYIDYVRLLP